MIHADLVVSVESLSSSGDGVGRVVPDARGKGAGRVRGRAGGYTFGSRPAPRPGKGGDGSGEGRVVFVPGTVPGDTVRVRVTGERKRFLLARPLEVLTPGEHRTTPRCAHFGRCGGCDWQQLDYPAQLRAKEAQLRETLARIGELHAANVAPIVASPHEYGYRNRIQGELRGGRYHQRERGSGDLVPIERCEIAEEGINARLRAGFDPAESGRVELAGGADGAVVLPIADDRSTELGFRQVNGAVEERLIGLLADSVARTETEHVVDLYCGRGAWTLRLAARCPERRFVGVDAAPDNIRAARTSGRERGLANVEFRLARVETQLGRLPLADAACIVDPPRAGLDRTVVEALIERPARRLWYVSCHPATLARDLALLCAGPYRLEEVQPLDMFPQTAHLECLARLSVGS